MELSSAETAFISKHLEGEIRDSKRAVSGSNNYVSYVNVDNSSYVLKKFFVSSFDSRDRFAHELEFSSCMHAHDIRCVPKVVAACREKRLILFEHVKGSTIDVATENAVLESAAFVNRLVSLSADVSFSLSASEACFSKEQYLESVAYRIQRLLTVPIENDLDSALKLFVEGELMTRFELLSQSLDFEPVTHKVISPSDFGFHNALATPAGLVFYDFEYAGWDDPAKLVGDFLLQPRVRLGQGHWVKFVELVTEEMPDKERFRDRLSQLLPLLQLKWCCILLNEFVKSDNARRIFADKPSDYRVKEHQLKKSRKMFERVLHN